MEQVLKKNALWHINIGLLGINFAWGLQMANMSAIYETLGAQADQIPILWLAAPLTGLLVQPVIGWLSDNTWCRFGRRRPYLLVGSLLAALALIIMPLSHSIVMAAISLWLLDAMVNVSSGPYRALIPEVVPASQQKRGYVLQGICIASGSVFASFFPWILQHVFHVPHAVVVNGVPVLIKLSFWIGAIVLIFTMCWSVFSIKELPYEQKPLLKFNFFDFVQSFKNDIVRMPRVMRDVMWVMMLSWTGLFCMFLYLPLAILHKVFHATPNTALYEQGLVWVNVCFGAYSVFVLLSSLSMPFILKRLSPKLTYALYLACGGLGLMSISIINTPMQVLFLMLGVGIAFGSTQSIPYALVAESLPKEKLGSYMGIFNLFIVIPEIIVSLGFGWVMEHMLGGQRYLAVVFGGVVMLLASLFAMRIRSQDTSEVILREQFSS